MWWICLRWFAHLHIEIISSNISHVLAAHEFKFLRLWLEEITQRHVAASVKQVEHHRVAMAEVTSAPSQDDMQDSLLKHLKTLHAKEMQLLADSMVKRQPQLFNPAFGLKQCHPQCDAQTFRNPSRRAMTEQLLEY
jgi:hypothetical protein